MSQSQRIAELEREVANLSRQLEAERTHRNTLDAMMREAKRFVAALVASAPDGRIVVAQEAIEDAAHITVRERTRDDLAAIEYVAKLNACPS